MISVTLPVDYHTLGYGAYGAIPEYPVVDRTTGPAVVGEFWSLYAKFETRYIVWAASTGVRYGTSEIIPSDSVGVASPFFVGEPLSYVSGCFDANGYLMAATESTGTIRVQWEDSGVQEATFSGTSPRLFFMGGLVYESTDTVVLCFYLRNGSVMARSSSDNFNTETLVVTPNETVTRLTGTDQVDRRCVLWGIAEGSSRATSKQTALQSAQYAVLPDASPEVTEWVSRILAAGGVTPSANTLYWADRFVSCTQTLGIYDKIHVLNFIAPDTIIAAATPFKKGTGYDSWVNTFGPGSLTVDGLLDDGFPTGSAAYALMRTGVFPDVEFSTPEDIGFVIVNSSNAYTLGSNYFLFTENGGIGLNSDSWGIINTDSFLRFGWTMGRLGDANGTQAEPEVDFKGYRATMRSGTSATAISVYAASETFSHAKIRTAKATQYTNFTGIYNPWDFMGYYINPTSVTFPSTSRCSFMAITEHLTEAQSGVLATCVRELRLGLGGGWG